MRQVDIHQRSLIAYRWAGIHVLKTQVQRQLRRDLPVVAHIAHVDVSMRVLRHTKSEVAAGLESHQEAGERFARGGDTRKTGGLRRICKSGGALYAYVVAPVQNIKSERNGMRAFHFVKLIIELIGVIRIRQV